jgi:hypothetical protein
LSSPSLLLGTFPTTCPSSGADVTLRSNEITGGTESLTPSAILGFQDTAILNGKKARFQQNIFEEESCSVFDDIPDVTGSKFGPAKEMSPELSPKLRKTRSTGDLSSDIKLDKDLCTRFPKSQGTPYIEPKRASMGDMVDKGNPFFHPKQVDLTTRLRILRAGALAPRWKSLKGSAEQYRRKASYFGTKSEKVARE